MNLSCLFLHQAKVCEDMFSGLAKECQIEVYVKLTTFSFLEIFWHGLFPLFFISCIFSVVHYFIRYLSEVSNISFWFKWIGPRLAGCAIWQQHDWKNCSWKPATNQTGTIFSNLETGALWNMTAYRACLKNVNLFFNYF